jgi:sugar-specific transcriptional regulator TrmB
VSEETLLGDLQRLGIPGYEAKAYLALLSGARPMNGYEVAKASGVPRSTVYETLTKLVRRGIAFEVRSNGDQTQYLPLPGDALLARLRRHYEDAMSDLESGLRDVTQPAQPSLIYHLEGSGAVFERAHDLIRGARESIHVSGWPDHFHNLEASLRDAEARGVAIWIQGWGGPDIDVGTVYKNPLTKPNTPHDRTEWILNRLGSQLLIVVGDRRAVLTASTNEHGVLGVYTDDPAVVQLGLEAIVHYIACDAMISAMGPQEFLKFWEADEALLRLGAGLSPGPPPGATRRPR